MGRAITHTGRAALRASVPARWWSRRAASFPYLSTSLLALSTARHLHYEARTPEAELVRETR